MSDKYEIEECDSDENEPRMWHVIDRDGKEVFGPTEDPAACEEWINEH